MPFLYNCGINVPAGYRLSRELTNLANKNLTTSQISHIRVWIVDQNGAPVNLREDELVVTLSLQLKKRVTQVFLRQFISSQSKKQRLKPHCENEKDVELAYVSRMDRIVLDLLTLFGMGGQILPP